MTAIAFCPQSAGVEVTIHRIDFVKVNYDTKVTGITVTAKKTQLAAGKVTTCTAAITPEKATRQIVKWSSSDEELATVNYQGAVVAGSTKEGTVTITAEATDGSGVKGTVTIQIGGTAQTTATPPADEGAPTIADNGDATLTLAANEIKASTNNGSNTITDNIEKTDDGIVYKGGYKMQMLDISEYLEKYNLDLGNYTSIEITGKLLDAEGNELKCGSGKAKTQLVTKANLNGFADGMAGGYKAFPTIDIDISAVEATDLAGAVGFNIQLNPDTSDEEWTAALAKYTTMVITSIKLNGASSVTPPGPEDPDDPGNDDPNEPVVSGNETSLVLAADEIVASSNGTTGNIEKTKDGILYKDAKTMQKLDISAYLEKYELDLSDYASIEITGKLLDENGDEVTCADGKIKTALVNKDNLNGYSDGYNTRKFKQFPTISVDISDIEATDLAQAVGFNLQVDDDWFKGDGSAYTTMLITSIKLIKAE